MEKDYLLRKWLSNELTPEELVEFKKTDDYDLNVRILEGAGHFEASQFSKVKPFDDLKTKLDGRNRPVVKFNSYRVLIRIAAVLVIALGVYFGFFANPTTTVKTLASQKTTFELPDASTVMLNADSKLAFSKKHWAVKREVHLDGEAFFKVAKGSKFDVLTKAGTVSVLGTQFDVKERNSYFEVQCFEGIVLVRFDNSEYTLNKGKVFRYVNGASQLDSIAMIKPDWLSNNTTFKSVPLYLVIDELERQYGVAVITKNIDTNRLFTGGFVNDDLEEALIAISVPFNLNYSKSDSNKIILYTVEE